MGGDDQLQGAAGNDQLDGGAGRDTVLGGAGDDLLTGAGGSDSLADGAGADTLVGGLGADRLSLTADGARDVVRITHLADAGDKVLGFVRGEDAIELSRAGLGVAADATLAELFTLGAAAPAGSEYALIYNAATGQLRADTNGADAGGVIILATLTERPLLTIADLTLIA
jgi:Ca2+-binding RTX toxin-like protein